MNLRIEKAGGVTRRQRAFVVTVRFGPGAGCKSLNGRLWRQAGRTLFLAYQSGSKDWRESHGGGQRHFLAGCKRPWEHLQIGNLEFGYTRNANAVPYAGGH